MILSRRTRRVAVVTFGVAGSFLLGAGIREWLDGPAGGLGLLEICLSLFAFLVSHALIQKNP